MKTITVFTPTYNRAHLLPILYSSLCRQTSNNFVWLVIDDGSIDNTKILVQEWTNEGKIEIKYFYKENGGMHTAHNAAYKLIETELNVCIDSDDYLPDNAIEKILLRWDSIGDKSAIAGIIGLDAEKNGKIIGSKIPSQLTKGSLFDLYQRDKVKGDKKLIIRTDLIKKYPSYPEYDGEKLVPPGVLYFMIGKDYNFAYSNDVYCIVDYQTNGSSDTIFRQYKQSPKGFAYARKVHIKYSPYLKDKCKCYIHLISSALFARDISMAFKEVNPFWSICFFPLGFILNMYVRSKIKQQ